jgi:hypothetical protein
LGFHPESYSEFFVRKDFMGDFSLDLIKQYSNIHYGGYGFTGNKYFPLPMDIELSKPDTSIYNPILPSYNKRDAATIKAFQNGFHFRFSLDDKTVSDALLSRVEKISFPKNFYVHDYNVAGIDGSIDAINEIRQRYIDTYMKIPTIYFKFPL